MTRRNGLFVILAALLCLMLLAGCSAQPEVDPEQPEQPLVEQPGQDADVDLFLEEHPGYRALTEERAQVSEYLRPYDEASEGVVSSALLSGFVRRAYYADPTQINLDELLRYNSLCELVTDEAEYQALKQVEGWYRGEDATLVSSLTPVWRYSDAAVDQLLQKYVGITRASLPAPGAIRTANGPFSTTTITMIALGSCGSARQRMAVGCSTPCCWWRSRTHK